MSDNLTIKNKDNNEIKDNMQTIKNYRHKQKNNLLPNIKKKKLNIKALKLLKEIDEKKEKNRIFLTNGNISNKDFKTARFRKKRNSLIDLYNTKEVESKKDFNVFGKEDNFIKNLMDKFNQKSLPRIKKIDKRKLVLDKLYGIDPLYKKRMIMAKSNKKIPLEEYQVNTFKVLSSNDIGKSELFDLAYDLKCLRLESDSVTPLPPINVSIIYDHVYRNNSYSNRDRSKNKMSIKQFINDTHKPKDEFEKEAKIIKQMMSYKPIPRGKRNKAFDILPEYLKTALSKQLKNNI